MIRTTVSPVEPQDVAMALLQSGAYCPKGSRFESGWVTVDSFHNVFSVFFSKGSLGLYVIIIITIIGTSVCDKNHSLTS